MRKLLIIPLYIILLVSTYSFSAKNVGNLLAENTQKHGDDYFVSLEDEVNVKKLERECFKKKNGKSCSILGAALYEENPKKSFKVYKKGCELKDPTSCYNVGDFYRVGDFVKKNEKKAIYYFKLSCKYSLEKDENYCGGCYLLGDYFLSKKKYKEAAIYYDKDCRNACCEACYKVEYLSSKKFIPKKFFKALRKKNKNSYDKCDLMNKLSSGSDFELGD